MLCVAFHGALLAGTTRTKDRPNVLFIAIDDLNDWIGCLGGHPQAKTPNLDRLAGRGVLFTHAYCSAPACNPSRASLMTGIRPSTSGVYHNNQPWRTAMPDAVTLPQHFMARDYEVVGGGKIYHGRFPDSASWQSYFRRPHDPVPPDRPVNGIPRTAHFDWGPVEVEDREMSDYKVADWAIRFLEEEHSKPFFLAVGFFRPHLPWYVPPKYFRAHDPDEVVLPSLRSDDLADVPAQGKSMAKPGGDHRKVLGSDNWRKAVASYLASVAFVDTMLGRVLDALGRSAHSENTIIVLWGDHGWHLGEKQHWRKFALWEEATRVPLIIAAPGVTTTGQRCHRTVSLLDLYPTLIDLCDLPTRSELEGRSLVPLLENPGALWDRPVVTTHGRGHHAIRSERWRYIRYSDGTEELYDHDADPLEWENAAGRESLAAIKKKLAGRLPKVDAPETPRRRNASR